MRGIQPVRTLKPLDASDKPRHVGGTGAVAQLSTRPNKSLKNRGDIDIWLPQNLIKDWYYEERIYDGTGSSKHYTDEVIIACHRIRQVYIAPPVNART